MGRFRAVVAGSGLIGVTCAVLLCGVPQASVAAPFSDVPPWHWASDAVAADQAAGLLVGYPSTPAALAENAVTQVYNGFTHAGAVEAQAWVERFTYNRPADWPAPMEHAAIAAFSLTRVQVSLHGDTAVAAFTATEQTTAGRTLITPVRVNMRSNGQDWQVDYAGLAAADPVFR